MSDTNFKRLGNLQLKIMKVLWVRGKATVTEVHDSLGNGADLAYTTVATMLRKMEQKGLVSHENQGRTFVYSPSAVEDEVTRGMTGDLLDRVFEGSLADMVSHLLSSREVSGDELDRIEQLIAQRKKKL
jgi:BlaI family penicillinase repressor